MENKNKDPENRTIAKATADMLLYADLVDSCSFANIGSKIRELEESFTLVDIDAEFTGANDVVNNYIGVITDTGQAYTLVLTDKTVYSRSIRESRIAHKEKLYIIGVPADNYIVPIVIIRKEDKKLFEMINTLDKRAKGVIGFYKLPLKKQEIILKKKAEATYERFDVNMDTKFDSLGELSLMYELSKEQYPLEIQKTIEMLLGKRRDTRADARLNYLLKSNNECEDMPMVGSFMATLNKELYGQQHAKDQLQRLFRTTSRRKKGKGCKILLIGPSGIGKKALVKAYAKASRKPLDSIELSQIETPFELNGLDPGYDGSDAGKCFKSMYFNGKNEVLCLSGLDKTNRKTKDGDPMYVIESILDGQLYEKFLQCHVPTDELIIFSTAEYIDEIPSNVLDKFDVIIHMEEYSVDEKIEVAKKYIIPRCLKKYGLIERKVNFTDESLKLIIEKYCADEGCGDLETCIKQIIAKIIEDKEYTEGTVTAEETDEILAATVKETPALKFARTKTLYPEGICEEIRNCLRYIQKNLGNEHNKEQVDKMKRKLDYLLACKLEEKTFLNEEFDPNYLKCELHKNLFGMDEAINEVTNIFYSAYLQGKNLNTNLALCGDPGVGKTAIIKCIAKAMGYGYAMISLNGVSDPRQLRGFPYPLSGSEPSKFIKGIHKEGSTKIVIHLDELDKLSSQMAELLLDVLERSFTDDYLEAPVDLSQVIFIATANDWGRVPFCVRDRFIKVDIEGYTRREKGEILNKYIVPKIQKGYETSDITIEFDEEAETFLLKNFAQAFGVRDLEKSVQRIVTAKMLELNVRLHQKRHIVINKDDVEGILGRPHLSKGNFPEKVKSGVSRALGVCGSTGSSFAIETVLIDSTHESEQVEITGLARETVVDSVKIALTIIKGLYPKMLCGKDVHIHFGEGSVPKDGPSAGVAILMSILSAGLNKAIFEEKAYDIAYTGEISLSGGVFAVGGVLKKVQAAHDAGCKKVFIPKENYESLDKDKLEQYDCEVIPAGDIEDIMRDVFPQLKIA